jgi:hypothetical protein
MHLEDHTADQDGMSHAQKGQNLEIFGMEKNRAHPVRPFFACVNLIINLFSTSYTMREGE